MPLKLVSAPTIQPLHVNDVRQHVKQDIEDDDNLISLYLGAAVEFAQMQTQRQAVAARYQFILDAFPGPSLMGVPHGKAFGMPVHAILIPRTPLVQVISIEYTAMDGTTQVMPSTDYTIDINCDPPRITPVFGKIWPIPLPQIGSVRVNFIAGYVAPVTVNVSGNDITVFGWRPMQVNDVVRLSNSGGNLPEPLQQKTDYYIKTVESTGVYTLSATVGGAAVDLTTLGRGYHYLGQPDLNSFFGEIPDGFKAWMLLRCDSLYSHRGETASTRGVLTSLPWIDRLLDPYRVVSA